MFLNSSCKECIVFPIFEFYLTSFPIYHEWNEWYNFFFVFFFLLFTYCDILSSFLVQYFIQFSPSFIATTSVIPVLYVSINKSLAHPVTVFPQPESRPPHTSSQPSRTIYMCISDRVIPICYTAKCFSFYCLFFLFATFSLFYYWLHQRIMAIVVRGGPSNLSV